MKKLFTIIAYHLSELNVLYVRHVLKVAKTKQEKKLENFEKPFKREK